MMDLSPLTEHCVDLLCSHVTEAVTLASKSGSATYGHNKKPCAVVVDPRLASLFSYAAPSLLPSLNATTAMFSRAGAMREFVLNGEELDWREDGPIVFYLRPSPQTCRFMAAQIRSLSLSARSRLDLRAVFIPRRSYRCEQVLKQENVFNLFTQGIHAVSLGFVNIEPDLLSLEMDDFLRETRVEGDLCAYTFAARALMDLGDVSYSKIRGKGFAAKEVLDLYHRMRSEIEESTMKKSGVEFFNSLAEEEDDKDSHGGSSVSSSSAHPEWKWINGDDDVGEDESDTFKLATQVGGPLDRIGGFPRPGRRTGTKADTVLVMDRELDMISPLLTPLTYEAMLDESFGGIKPGFLLPVKSSLLRLDEEEMQQGSQLSSSDVAVLDLKDDSVFKVIRGESVMTVMATLNQTARELKEEQERMHRVNDPQELQLIVQRVPELQDKKRKLTMHIALCQRIRATTLDRRTKATIDAERKLVFDSDPYPLLDRAQDAAARGESLLKVLRLLCLTCIVSGGFTRDKLDEYRRDVIHAYGFQTVLTLEALERLGMLAERPFHPQHKFAQAERAKTGRAAPSCIYTNWNVIRQTFEISVDESKAARDVAYVFSGIAPLSARLIELEALKGGWRENFAALRLLGEAPPWFKQEAAAPSHSGSSSSLPAKSKDKKVMVVFFLGGVSRPEIAALRFLSSRPDCPFKIVIATTAILNGTDLIKSCCHPNLFGKPTQVSSASNTSSSASKSQRESGESLFSNPFA